MRIFESELAIPEFENLPYKEARQIWRQFYFGNTDWFNLTILIGPLTAGLGAFLGVFCFGSQPLLSATVGGFIGAQIGFDIHRQIMIRHLRPKIREHINQQPKN